jgi:phosphatidate phosphatase APP1
MTNKKGLFHTVMPCAAEAGSISSSADVKFTMIDEIVEDQGVIEKWAKVHFVDEQCDFNIISDIDDTIMISHSTSFFKKMRLMMFKNAHSRKPFEGIGEFYKSLVNGNENFKRSIFYVSGSEWNLYDLLVDFIRYWHIPEGPLLLSEMKTSLLHLFRSGKKIYGKLDRIQELFEVFSDQKFLLIGDSGQKDPELYLEISKMFPSRVVLIYLRYIGNRKHNKRLEKLKQTAEILGVKMILVKDTAKAHQHAIRSGIIN